MRILRSRRGMRRRSPIVVGAMVAVVGTAFGLGQIPAAYAASSSGLAVIPGGPLTDTSDFITGLTDCGLGPVGLSVEPTRTFVTDYCDSTTSLYDTSSGTPTLTASVANGLTHGIAQIDGVYFGVASNNQTIAAPGIWEFSPRTLQLTRQITQDPCGDIRGLAADPTAGDLILSGDCGIYRVKGLNAQNPFLTPIVAGNIDGIAVDPATGTVWAALNGDDQVNQYNLATGALVTSVSVGGGPDGIAFAAPGSPGGIGGNVFVNPNAGTIVMIDVHAANATSTVASGGRRGDFVTVGSDGYLYVTQPSSIVQVKPNVFVPVPGGPTSDPGSVRGKLRIIALGDSYSAGNGARDSAGKKTFYGPDRCFRSRSSWEELYRSSLIAKGYDVETLQNFACSGSVTYHYANEEIGGPGTSRFTDVFGFPARAKVKTPITVADCQRFQPDWVTPDEYLSVPNPKKLLCRVTLGSERWALRRAADAGRVDLLTATFGGNDGGFADIVKYCFVIPAGGAFGELGAGSKCKELVDTAFKLVHGNAYDAKGWCEAGNADAPCTNGRRVTLEQSLVNVLVDMYKQAKPTKIAYVGYPYLAPNNSYELPTWHNSFQPMIKVRALLDDADVMQTRVVSTANDRIAAQYGGVRPIVFVSANHPADATHSFNGHEPYPSYIGSNSNRWVHEFKDAKDLDQNESYHPNSRGHQAYANLMTDARLF
jgi:hypothetical protein